MMELISRLTVTLALVSALIGSPLFADEYDDHCGPTLTESGSISAFIQKCEGFAERATDLRSQAAAITEVAKATVFAAEFEDFDAIEFDQKELSGFLYRLNTEADTRIDQWQGRNPLVKPNLLLELISLSQHLIYVAPNSEIPKVENYFLAIRSAPDYPIEGKRAALDMTTDVLARTQQVDTAVRLLNSSLDAMPYAREQILRYKLELLIEQRKFLLAYGTIKNLQLESADRYRQVASAAFDDRYYQDAILGYQRALNLEVHPIEKVNLLIELAVANHRVDELDNARQNLTDAAGIITSIQNEPKYNLAATTLKATINRIRVGLEL